MEISKIVWGNAARRFCPCGGNSQDLLLLITMHGRRARGEEGEGGTGRIGGCCLPKMEMALHSSSQSQSQSQTCSCANALLRQE